MTKKMTLKYNEHRCPFCGNWGDYFEEICHICKKELKYLTLRHRWNPLTKFTMYQGEEYEYEQSEMK